VIYERKKQHDQTQRTQIERSYELFEIGGDTMVRRIVVPVIDERVQAAQLSQHFGRAPYFAVVDIDDDNQVIKEQTIANTSEHFGGVGRPPDRILQLKPDALITYGMGPRALTIFQNARVAVLRTTALTVGDVVTLYTDDALEELTEGCHHARHH
jgi:predicted Fe-Mo cluster-binding NifX family protein